MGILLGTLLGEGEEGKWQGQVNMVFSVGLLTLYHLVLIFYVKFSYALCEQWYNGRYSHPLAGNVLEHNPRDTDDGSLLDNRPTGSGPKLLMKAGR